MSIEKIYRNAHTDLLYQFEALAKEYEKLLGVAGIELDFCEAVVDASKKTVIRNKNIQWGEPTEATNDDLHNLVPSGVYRAKLIGVEYKAALKFQEKEKNRGLKYKLYKFQIVKGRCRGDTVFYTCFIKQDANLIDERFSEGKHEQEIQVEVRHGVNSLRNDVKFAFLQDHSEKES